MLKACSSWAEKKCSVHFTTSGLDTILFEWNGASVSGKFQQKCPVRNHLHSWRNHKIMHTHGGYTSIQKFVLITLCPICTDFQAPYLPLHTGAWWSHITYRLYYTLVLTLTQTQFPKFSWPLPDLLGQLTICILGQ